MDSVAETEILNGNTISIRPATRDNMAIRKSSRFEVVAIGASAGGLSALRQLLEPLPASFPLPLLIVQHLAPSHVSLLAHILSRHTRLTVKEAEHGATLAPGHAYIAPPGQHLLAGPSGTLELTDTELVHFSRPSVDKLFESVAKRYGAQGIAIILTGAGKDGAAGLRAVKKAGGVTIVQDPRTAEYSSMPHFAVATQSADHVLSMERIPSFLLDLVTRGDVR
jgi:two-component system, chemotaxis family, protein-glutamate methylesterase/glutaminase